MPEKATFSVKEAAAYLGVSLPTMYELTDREDFFPLLTIGRKKLILKDRFVEWMNQQSATQKAN